VQTVAEPSAERLLRVVDRTVFYGPNPHASLPVTVCTLEAGPCELTVETFHDRLKAMFPKHFRPAEAPSEKPVSSLDLARAAGSLMAALLQDKIGLELHAGAAAAQDGKADVWIEHFHPALGREALRFVIAAIRSVLAGHPPSKGPLAKLAQQFNDVANSARPNFESLILIETARARGIPYMQIASDHGLWQFGWGIHSEQFWITASNGDSMIAQRTAHDKLAAKRRFLELGVPTPKWRLLSRRDDPAAAAEAIGWPCVAKPLRSGGGKGVSADIRDLGGLREAVRVAFAYSDRVLVEQHIAGNDYRLMVIDGRLVAAVRRDPPSVTGDGKRTVAELFAAFNLPRQRPERETGYLTPVADDDAFSATLARQGVNRETQLGVGQSVLLRTSANRSTGGSCTDVLTDVHPELAGLAVHLAAAFGFRATGIDYITPDISRSPAETGGSFLELNTTPGMRVILAGGMSEDELGNLFLGERPGRIPIALIVADPDVRDAMVASLRDRLAPTAAATAPDWAQIGSTPLPLADLDPVERVTTLLRYPTVDRVTIIWSSEELTRYGLPLDVVDKAIVQCADLPNEWHTVLESHAREIDHAHDTSETLAMLEGKVKEKAQPPRKKTSAAG